MTDSHRGHAPHHHGAPSPAPSQPASGLHFVPHEVPNRTKVVRLIVVPPDLAWENAQVVRPFAQKRNATRADTFIVRSGKGWVPMNWLGDALIDHDAAHDMHNETVPYVMREAREQIQWECDVPFEIVDVQKHDHGTQQPAWFYRYGMQNDAHSPARPFRFPNGTRGGYGVPVVSGPVLWDDRGYNHLYQATYAFQIDGQRVVIDPDTYCDWRP